MKVKECNLSDEFSTCEYNETVVEIARRMKTNKSLNYVIVVDDQEPVGVITLRDIVNKVVSEGKNPNEVKASNIMSSPIITVNEEDDIENAANIMMKKNFLSVPVVNEENKLLGIITIYDVVGKLRKMKKSK